MFLEPIDLFLDALEDEENYSFEEDLIKEDALESEDESEEEDEEDYDDYNFEE